MPLLSTLGGGSAKGFGAGLGPTGPEPFDAIELGSRTLISTPALSFYSVANSDTTQNGPDADNTPYSANVNFSLNRYTVTNSGTKVYSTDYNGYLYEYDLDTAYDIRTAIYANRLYVQSYSHARNPLDIHMKSDGTRAFVINAYNRSLRQFNLSTAWDISTGSYSTSSGWSGASSCRGIFIKSDGTRWWVIDGSFDRIVQHDMSTAWTANTSTSGNSSRTMSLSANGCTDPQDVTFNSNGTKMYVTNNNGRVYVWNLGSAWNVLSSVTFDNYYDFFDLELRLSNNFYGVSFNNTGSYFYTSGIANIWEQYSLSTAYDLSSTISFANEPTQNHYQTLPLTGQSYYTASGIFFSSDGTKFYVIETAANKLCQYNMSTAWNLSTISGTQPSASISISGSNHRGLWFKSDGTSFYYLDDPGTCRVYQYNMSTAWDVSTASSDGYATITNDNYYWGLAFSADGTQMYASGYSNNRIYQYELSTAWDVSTAGSQKAYLDCSTYANNMRHISISNNGRQVFVFQDGTYDRVVHTEFVLDTAWDISSGNYYDTYNTNIHVPRPFSEGFYIRPNGTFACFGGSDHFICFSMPTPAERSE